LIRLNDEHQSRTERGLVPPPIQIEPTGMRVYLDSDVVPGACAQHLLDVDS
jgi:hypothetical protein